MVDSIRKVPEIQSFTIKVEMVSDTLMFLYRVDTEEDKKIHYFCNDCLFKT